MSWNEWGQTCLSKKEHIRVREWTHHDYMIKNVKIHGPKEMKIAVVIGFQWDIRYHRHERRYTRIHGMTVLQTIKLVQFVQHVWNSKYAPTERTWQRAVNIVSASISRLTFRVAGADDLTEALRALQMGKTLYVAKTERRIIVNYVSVNVLPAIQACCQHKLKVIWFTQSRRSAGKLLIWL